MQTLLDKTLMQLNWEQSVVILLIVPNQRNRKQWCWCVICDLGAMISMALNSFNLRKYFKVQFLELEDCCIGIDD